MAAFQLRPLCSVKAVLRTLLHKKRQKHKKHNQFKTAPTIFVTDEVMKHVWAHLVISMCLHDYYSYVLR